MSYLADPPSPTQMIFGNSEAPSFSQILTTLKHKTRSIHNRLTSIHEDAQFVSLAAESFPYRPLVANERCGSWYIPPHRKDISAYFKSTDGHERAWKFSTRRLNLHIIELVEDHDGVIIVDSTRRGKRMPDALSTTIPIWCTVMNLILLPDDPRSRELHLPPYMARQTHAAIEALIPSFVTSLQSLDITLPTCLTKPLRPYWITQDSHLPYAPVLPGDLFDFYRPVICCTASRRIVGETEAAGGGYVQGAADDAENWAQGLTPSIFWANADVLLNSMEEDLPGAIQALMLEEEQNREHTGIRRKLNRTMSVCALPLSSDGITGGTCYVVLLPEVTPKETWIKGRDRIVVGLGKGKAASKNLRLALDEICDFVFAFLTLLGEEESPGTQGQSQGQDGKIVIGCESGKDLSVGTGLAIQCYLFDEAGHLRIFDDRPSFTKTFVKKVLGNMMAAYPEANPSRSTLQAVNSFLMDWTR